MFTWRTSFLAAVFCVWAASAFGQAYGAGGGGGGGLSSFTGSCGIGGSYSAGALTVNGTSLVGNNGSPITGSTYTVQSTSQTHPDCGTLLLFTGSGASSWTLGQAGAPGFATGYGFAILNAGTASITLTPTTSTIEPGAVSSIIIPPNEAVALQADSTNGYWEVMWASAGIAGEFPSCSGSGKALTFNSTTNVFGCNTISASGTVNSGTAPGVAYYGSTGTAVSSSSGLLLSSTAIIGGIITVASNSGTSCTLGTTSSGCSGLTNGDCLTKILFTSNSAVTVTIPATLPVGCQVAIEQGGTAKVSVNGTAVSAATLNSAHSYTGTYGQYSTIGVTIDTNSGGSAAVADLTGDGS